MERLRENQTGVENKTFKWGHVREWAMDYKTYLFFGIGLVANIPNGGISNFGTLIIKGFGYSTRKFFIYQTQMVRKKTNT